MNHLQWVLPSPTRSLAFFLALWSGLSICLTFRYFFLFFFFFNFHTVTSRDGKINYSAGTFSFFLSFFFLFLKIISSSDLLAGIRRSTSQNPRKFRSFHSPEQILIKAYRNFGFLHNSLWISFLTHPVMTNFVLFMCQLAVLSYTPLGFFTSALADGFSLESKWQQVSSSLQDSSLDFDCSQQCCRLDSLYSSANFQVLQAF